jgi:hypothetical protein
MKSSLGAKLDYAKENRVPESDARIDSADRISGLLTESMFRLVRRDSSSEKPDCPEQHRLFAEDITTEELSHFENCAVCHARLANPWSEHDSIFTRLRRRVRSQLMDWSPLLLVVVLITVTGVAWGGYQLRTSQQRRISTLQAHLMASLASIQTSSADKRLTMLPPPSIQTEKAAEWAAERKESTELKARIASTRVGWPWNTCGESEKDINKWLGQGRDRDDIEKMMGMVKRKVATRPVRRQLAEQRWCSSAGAGSQVLVRLLAVETHTKIVRNEKSRIRTRSRTRKG